MNHFKPILDQLDQYELDAMLITSQPGAFYATGFQGEGAALVSKTACRYYTDSRYLEAANRTITGADVVLFSLKSPCKELLAQAVKELGIKRLGFEEDYQTVSQHKSYQDALSCTLVPAQKLLSTLRASKDEEEIARMTKAQEITDQAFTQILSFLQPGRTEREIAAKLQYDMLCLGAAKMSFDPIVVTGPNGSLPHGVPGDRVLESGQFVTMDFGCIYEGYCSDMTRTVCIGTPTDEMRKVYDTVLQAQLAGIAATRAGVPGKDIDAAARNVIEAAGYGDFFGHGYGHSVGIEIHESPNASAANDKPMPVNAAVSAEPGIYLPGRFGVRIEDVVILKENGCVDLTRSPKELIVL